MSVWHQSCIENICVDFSLNKPDFSSEKWTCPNCCKIWIIMCFWIHLGVVDHKADIVDHKVNKESTLYWLMCYEHFESIRIIGDTVFIDFNPNLFSKIFLGYVYTFQKFKIWVYHFFELFLRKLFSSTLKKYKYKWHICGVYMKSVWSKIQHGVLK